MFKMTKHFLYPHYSYKSMLFTSVTYESVFHFYVNGYVCQCKEIKVN